MNNDDCYLTLYYYHILQKLTNSTHGINNTMRVDN